MEGGGDWWAGLQCAVGPYSNPWQEYTGCKTVQLRAPMPPNPRWEGGGGGGCGCDKEAGGGISACRNICCNIVENFFSQEFEQRSSLRLYSQRSHKLDVGTEVVNTQTRADGVVEGRGGAPDPSKSSCSCHQVNRRLGVRCTPLPFSNCAFFSKVFSLWPHASFSCRVRSPLLHCGADLLPAPVTHSAGD